MGMDGFEDYTYDRVNEAHFNFKKSNDSDGAEGIQISDTYAHSGRNSMLIPANDEAQTIVRIHVIMISVIMIMMGLEMPVMMILCRKS